MFHFKTSSPEAQGIQSEHILHTIKRLEMCKIPMHSILIMRNDHLVYEGYYQPYNALKHHRMFSISKTFTAIAVGHLITLGKLHLDDHIADYFPEKCPENLHPWIKAMTIRNMLEMRTCHSTTTYKHNMKSDWVASFFHVQPDHPAGTVFHYDTSSPHVLCALVEKITGKSLYDYIKEDVMPELELSQDGFMLTDPFKVSMGGSGLCCTSTDLLKVGYFLLHDGNINGRQVINKDYLANACSDLNPTIVKAGNPSESQGYGYQIWRHERDGYVAYGMGGQYIFVCPKQNMVIVTTADTQGYGGANQLIHNAIFEELLDKICDRPLAENTEALHELRALTETLKIPAVAGNTTSPIVDDINSKTFDLLENPLTLSQAALSFHEDSGTLVLQGAQGTWTFSFGLGKMAESTLPLCPMHYVASGAWLTDQIFYMKGHICDTSVGSFHIQLHFEGNQMTVYYRIIEETMAKEIPAGHLIGYCN